MDQSKKSKIYIITGASGFIGSYITNNLLNNNYYVIGIDIDKNKFNMSTYYHIQKDLSDERNNKYIINEINIIMESCDINDIYVFHLAAKISVEESMENPILYYKNNIGTTYNILEIMRKLGLNKIFFSSTAAVYDSTNNQKFLDVDSAICPSSIYGHSKYLAEEIIEKYVNLYNFKAVVFRFFNVGGGKDSKKAHHLIPKLVSAILEDKNWYVYGKNYDTKDGTCIRDYIHVEDIYIAFLMAIQLESKYSVINLGSGYGYSVLDVIEICKNVLTKSFNKYKIPRTIFKERRAGDPDILVADITRTFLDLNWNTSKTLEDIVLDTMVSYGMEYDS